VRRASAGRQLVTVVAFPAAGGVDPSEIARRAGHSSVSFTYDRYGHLFPEIDKQAAQKLERVRSALPREIPGVT
jgi:integrase